MNCNNCKHWGHKDDLRPRNQPQINVKKCHKVPMFWDATDWDENGHDLVFTSDSLAFTQDASDYKADLLTKPEFYCNMWEGK